MNNRDLEFIEEESSSLHKPTEDSQVEGKTNYDYAKILAEMKKELENIPTKYPNAADDNDISSQKYSEPSESLELNMVKTGDIRNNKEETSNIAYSDDSKKDISEDNEPYDEDFEQSEDKAQSSNQVATGRNESAQSSRRETPNPEKTNPQATVKREKSSPMKKNTSQEDDYENDDFEEEVVDDDISEIKREKSISSKRSTPPPVVVKKDDKKAPPPSSKTQNNSKPPQPVQSNSAKNFKIKNGPIPPVNKDVKKEPTARPSSSKEPIKQPVQPPKDPKTMAKPPVKRPATAKAVLNKTTALVNIKNSNTNKEPAAKAMAKTTTEKMDKVDEDFEFVEEEEMVADQNANPIANKAKTNEKMQERPKTVGAKSREQVSNNDEEVEIIKEEDMQAAEDKKTNKFKPVKKVEHKDIMKQIFDSFKKKEEVNQKKDEKIFATEEADKRVKTAGAAGKNKAEDQENKWIGNGLGLTTNVVDATKKGKTTSSANTKPEPGSSQSFAQKFLTSLENKFKKVPKLGQTTTPAQEGEETKEEDKKKRAQSAKKGGSQTSLEKTWKYNVGAGVNSEYEKTQKAKEKESQKRFTELFKKEKIKAKDQKQENLAKIKQIMNKERENRKAIEEKFVKNMRTGNKEDNKESRDPLVLQVQNVYLEEEERNKREKQKEEINQLKLKLKLLKQQNQGLQKDLVDLQHRDSNAGRQLDSLASKKAVIMIGKNEFASLNSHLIPKERSKASTTARSGQATERSNILEDENTVVNLDKLSPIEVIINKFADQELELEEIYQLLDKNGDGILTIKEIKEGLEKLNLDLDETEIQHIVSVVDANTDGTITSEEFVSSLKESLAVRKDYKSIMGDLDKITNPIVLEERILDMETRKKLIEEDTKKVTDELKVHEYGYKKLLRRLQEFEGMAGPKKETKADLDHIRNIIIRLKVEIQDAEDMKSRVELMQEERMKDITENIQTLEEKIERTIRRIQEEKRNAKDLAQEQQKEELRKIFMMKAFGEIEREMETFDTGLDKNVQKMIEEKQRLQAKREEEENMNTLDGHIQNGAAIKIQKIYRGSVSRRKAQNVSITLLRAKMVILKRWRSYKKRVKTVSLASKLKGLLRKVLGSAFENIKEHSEEKAQEHREQARIKEEKASPAGGKKTTTGERDDDELSQLSGVGENGVPLYTVLYLQDLARKKLGKDAPEEKLLYRKTNKKIQKCGVCRKEPIERVCKECEIAVFCTKCFATTHKSRKNHPFIEVKAKSNDEKTINLIESKDPEMAAELNYLQEKYQNEFKNLIAHMRDWDVENAGYFDIRGFRETLKRKVKDENELDFLVKVAKTYCKTDSKDPQIDYVLFANLVCS